MWVLLIQSKELLPESQEKLFEVWNRLDPVDEWELERARRAEQTH